MTCEESAIVPAMETRPAGAPSDPRDELRRRRAHSQLLHRPPGLAPTTIVDHLLAVQAQDPRSARLAIRARTDRLLATDVARELVHTRALVVGWLARGTLHMVRAEDYAWLLGLTGPGRLAQSRRRLAQEGLTPEDVERGVETVEHALVDGPLTRHDLAGRVQRRNIPAAGQAIVHLIMLAALRGIAIPAATRAGQQTFALTDDWLGHRPAAELHGDARDTALGELARRYLAGHGPAGPRDLARWAGLSLRDARLGLARIAGQLATPRADDLVSLHPDEPTDRPLRATLLPSFDPYMLGWYDRGFAVPSTHAKRVHPGGGMLRAVACDDGLAIATWRAERRASHLAVTIASFDLPSAALDAALATEAADVARFEGLELA
jgi:hypothetical protein